MGLAFFPKAFWRYTFPFFNCCRTFAPPYSTHQMGPHGWRWNSTEHVYQSVRCTCVKFQLNFELQNSPNCPVSFRPREGISRINHPSRASLTGRPSLITYLTSPSGKQACAELVTNGCTTRSQSQIVTSSCFEKNSAILYVTGRFGFIQFEMVWWCGPIAHGTLESITIKADAMTLSRDVKANER